MRKNYFGRQLKRDTKERQALFKNLLSSLVLEERIKTTEAKAKAIKADADKLVTKALKEVNLAKRLLGKTLNKEAMEKMIKDVAPRFKDRKGGYTRIVRLGKRFGDDASVVMMEWTEVSKAVAVPQVDKKEKKEVKKPVEKKTKQSKKETKKENKKQTKKAVKK